MRLPWTKREPIYLETPSKRRSKETIAQVSDRILIRKMKKDPDGYGLAAAERIKGIRREEPKTAVEFLKELTGFQTLMQEAGFGGGGGKGGEGLLINVLQALPHVPAILEQLRQPQGTVITERAHPAHPAHPAIQPAPQPRLEEPQKPKPDKLDAKIADLLEVIELEPANAYQALQDGGHIGWIQLLKSKSYEEIIAILQPLTKDATYGEYIQQFLEQKGKWIEEMVAIAHKTA